MSNSNFSQHRLSAGPDDLGDIGFTAETATETPQILLKWNKLDVECSGVRIVRNTGGTPSSVTDGLAVYTGRDLKETGFFADTLLLHEETYYYALFLKLDGDWYEPATGARDYAFSGSKPWLSVKEEMVSGNSTPITGTLDTFFRPSDDYVVSAGLAAKAEAGDWLRIGRDIRAMIARVISVSGSNIYIEFKDDEFTADPNLIPTPIELEEITITRTNSGYSNLSTIARINGESWAAAKYKAGYPVFINGHKKNKPGVVKTITAVYSNILTFPATLWSIANTRALRIETPAWRLPGELLTLMKSDGPFLVRKFYEEYTPDNVLDGDEDEQQIFDLQETALDSGEKVNLQSPGEQLGYERFLRAALMELAKAHGAASYRVKMRDLHLAPVAYARQFAGNYGFAIPENLADDVLSRSLALVQPRLAGYRGRADNILRWIKVLTLQTAQVIQGKNRVIRFGDADSGFAWSGVCQVLSVVDPTTFTVDTAVWGAPPSWLIGGSVVIVGSYENATYAAGPSITDISGGTITVSDTTGLTDGCDIIFAPDFPVLSGPRAFVNGLYDPEIVGGKGSFFNDRGIAYYLQSDITDDEKDLLQGYLEDVEPGTVSALVFAALAQKLDLR